eukprot:364869-Chlamydomonas_euryale.AAC.2
MVRTSGTINVLTAGESSCEGASPACSCTGVEEDDGQGGGFRCLRWCTALSQQRFGAKYSTASSCTTENLSWEEHIALYTQIFGRPSSRCALDANIRALEMRGEGGDHAMCDHALCDHALCDHALCDHALCDLAMCDHALCDHAMCDHALCGLALCDHAFCDLALYDHALCDLALCDHALWECGQGDHALCDHALWAGDHGWGEEVTAGRAMGGASKGCNTEGRGTCMSVSTWCELQHHAGVHVGNARGI